MVLVDLSLVLVDFSLVLVDLSLVLVDLQGSEHEDISILLVARWSWCSCRDLEGAAWQRR